MGIAIGAVVGAIVLGVGVYQSDASPQNPKLSVDDVRGMVGDQYPGKITEIELEKEKNKTVYEVEVLSNGREYDLKLDGHTGEVLNLKERDIKNKENIALNDKTETKKPESTQNTSEKEKNTNQTNVDIKEKSNNGERDDQKEVKSDNKAVAENKPKTESNKKTENKKTAIDSNKAVAIAKNQFSGTVTDLELDEDDGRLVYEIEMKNGNEEADFEIDAYTGKILLIDIERDDDDNDND